MKKQRITAMLLAMTMAMTAFTGCGDKEAEESGTDVTASSESTKDAEQAQESEAEEDDLFAEEVHLVYVLPYTASSMDGAEDMVEALNEITKEKINATVEIEWIPLGEYTDKMNMKFAAGEEFDLCFTGLWNPYQNGVTQGAYAELTEDLLNTYAPEYTAQLNPEAWEAVTLNGKIY